MSPSSSVPALSALFLALLVCSCCSWPTTFDPQSNSRSKRSVDVDNPDDVLRVLVKLAQSIVDAESLVHEKRGIDLGLSRGFSGSQAAKHLMGLAAANFANGPGRRRRDVSDH